MVEVGDVGVGVLDGIVVVPVGVAAVHVGGVRVAVVGVVVAVFVLVFGHPVAVAVLMRGA